MRLRNQAPGVVMLALLPTVVVGLLGAAGLSTSGFGLKSGGGANGMAVTPTSVTTASIVITGNGSLANNSFQPSGDANTGIRFPAADTINFDTSGALALQIDSANKVWHTAAVDVAGLLTTTTMTASGKSNLSPNSGTISLSTGTGTATVTSGATCVCTDSTANASVKCAVSTTTLTATGTGSDVIAYFCNK